MANQKHAQKSNSRWTKEDDQRLTELANAGSTTGKIATELGRTRSSIWARKCKLGLADVRLRPSRNSEVPVSIGTRTRKAVQPEVSEAKIETKIDRRKKEFRSNKQSNQSQSIFDNLENAARIAKKHGLNVTVNYSKGESSITFHS
jgi:hypothetical protein